MSRYHSLVPKSLLLTAVATLATVGTACSDGATALPSSPSGGPQLRVVNGALSPVAVLVDGAFRLTALAPASLSPSIDVSDGAHRVELRSLDGSGTTAALQVAPNGSTPVIVAATASAPGTLQALVIADTGAVPAAGMSKLRVLHMAAKAPKVDVWGTQPDYQTLRRMIFPFLYGASSSYLQSTPGTWEVVVTPAGDGTAVGTVLGRITLTAAANQARTVVILDAPGGGVRLETLDP